MRVVEQAVADGVGLVGVADDGVRVGDGQLAGDEGGGPLGPVLDDLGEVAAFGVAERCEHPVVDGEQVEPWSAGRAAGRREPSPRPTASSCRRLGMRT